MCSLGTCLYYHLDYDKCFYFFVYSWSLFKEHVNEIHPDSKNKELIKLHIYAGLETSPKHKVQGKIGQIPSL